MAIDHAQFMGQALRLAAKGRGEVEPNPMVGALVVKKSRVIATGWHKHYGGPHAEIYALNAAGRAARGGTLYVTLEPCVHFGKTPPCVDAVIKAGIREVVIATHDPFPKVHGAGIRKLKAAGVKVVEGVLADDALRLNPGYFKRIMAGMPWVIAKWAMTLDGKIAAYTGDSRGISSEEALKYAHRLRAQVDAIIVGINTVLRDDPLLNIRHWSRKNAAPEDYQPARIILDSSCRLPVRSQIVETARWAETIVAVSKSAPRARIEHLRKLGVEVLEFGRSQSRVDIAALLRHLGGEREFTNVLIEGGAEVLADAFERKVVDEVRAIIAPKILAGRTAVTAVGGAGIARIADALPLADVKISRLGPDTLIVGRMWPGQRSKVKGQSLDKA
jgi:diaminohydroxyphosphoribosylaminopyrimidine deaminase/5-amino-6-(5-phosphoribosylamino)uracil reductase